MSQAGATFPGVSHLSPLALFRTDQIPNPQRGPVSFACYLLYMLLAVAQWVSVFLALVVVLQSYSSLKSQYRPCMRELDHEALLNGVAASTVSLFVAAVGWVAFMLVVVGEDRLREAIGYDFFQRHEGKIIFGPPLLFLLLIVVVGASLGTSENLAYFNLVSPALLMHPEVE